MGEGVIKMRRKKRVLLLPILAAIALFMFFICGDGVPRMPKNVPSIDISSILDLSDHKDTPAADVSPDLAGPYDVVRVIDGDTAIINIDGSETRVRFIGVDTPESVNPDESKNTPEGKIASDFTKNLLTGKTVYLEYDVDPNDDYGRTLAYVYLDDGKTMVQEELLKEGLATVMTIQPNSKYTDHFYALQVDARESLSGFWNTGFFGG